MKFFLKYGTMKTNRMKYWLLASFLGLSAGVLTAQPDRAEVRRGNRAFARNEFATAELEYRRALEKDSTSMAAHYNLGNARYKQQQYEQAENGLKAKIESISLPVQRAHAFHNLGNMQLMQKKYAESIASYKDALRLRPDDMETKSNLAYAQKMLKNQEEQQQNQDQDQDQKDQDQKDQDQKQDQPQKQDQKQQQPPPKISPQDAKQMLEAMQQKEKETQEKVKKEQAKVSPPARPDKNW